MEGFETVMFRSKFESWPQATEEKESEDGKGKVAGEFMFMFSSSFILYSVKMELSVLISYCHLHSISNWIIINLQFFVLFFSNAQTPRGRC